MKHNFSFLLAVLSLLVTTSALAIQKSERPKFSGIYPHLAHTNSEREVGIGAVVPWAGSLWTNTYGPHLPRGSSDKLRQIDSNWNMVERPESVGGTPANRMIHRESKQLLMGHHLIDSKGDVRTIDPKKSMPGRITANARHLTDPKSKVYYLTMENGVYEVDVNTLTVKDIIRDPINISNTHLPGYHGKGAYTGSQRVVVSNNGEPNQSSPSGCLATWDGKRWTIVARNQFAEVTGPGGLFGNETGDDRVWATGWDAKSVRLFLLEDGKWHKFRLPKGSYTHDANHGWNTEWPRIRQVKRELTLMHMHGLFFDFPQTFSTANYGGLKPITTYIKMPVDYAWFNDKLVIAKDDASRFDNDFVEQSQSNLWIGDLEELNRWGPKSGFGGVWLNDSIEADAISEPFFIGGFQHAHLHLQHRGGFDCRVELQVDKSGKGDWKKLKTLKISKEFDYLQSVLSSTESQWIRLVALDAAHDLSAYFHLSSQYPTRSLQDKQNLFGGLVDITAKLPTSAAELQLPAGQDMNLNAFTSGHHFQIGGDLKPTQVDSTDDDLKIKQNIDVTADPRVGFDEASAFVNFQPVSKGKSKSKTIRLRLPKGNDRFDDFVGNVRHIREIVTERTAMNLHGTFYELPRPIPGDFLNFRQMKPICSHSKHIHDFCSWRGMLVMSGAKLGHPSTNHIALDHSGLWLGEVDDLWKLGKPTGKGGPWLNTAVKKDVPSDPYLMLGYDKKQIRLSHSGEGPVTARIEVDVLGNGEFVLYKSIQIQPATEHMHVFQNGFAAHWVRVVVDSDTNATAQFLYE